MSARLFVVGLCVDPDPVMDWRPVQRIPHLSPVDCSDKHPLVTLKGIKLGQKMGE